MGKKCYLHKKLDEGLEFTPNIDTIDESTAGAGVTIDGVKLKDSVPYCDMIAEKTAAAGVTVDGVKLKDGGIVCADGATVEADTINEATDAAGVTADGVLLKDGTVYGAIPAYTTATLPTASENTGRIAYVSDGDTGSPCLAYCNGTDWLRISLGAACAAS